MLSPGTCLLQAVQNISTLLANFTELLVVGLFLGKVLLPFLALLLVLVSNLSLGLALLLFGFFLGLLNSCHIVCSHGVFSLQKHILKLLVRVTLGLLLFLAVRDFSSLLPPSQFDLQLWNSLTLALLGSSRLSTTRTSALFLTIVTIILIVVLKLILLNLL